MLGNIRKKYRSVGIDLAEVSRFRPLCKKPQQHLLRKLFSAQEIGYCLGFRDPASHFAGTFAAKEAVAKVLGARKFAFAEIEIRRAKDGAPEAWRKGKKLNVALSISHTASLAVAIAFG